MELSWLSNDIVCHLDILAILPLPFHFGHLVCLFLFWLMQLGFPTVCWIEVVKVNIHVFFPDFPTWIFMERLSAFHHWVLCWLWDFHKWLFKYVPFIPTLVRIFVLNRYWILSNVFSASIEMTMYFCLFFCLCGDWLTLNMLNHPCQLWMNPIWLWCMIFFICCWIQFANILFRLYLHSSKILVYSFLCLVLVSGW